MEKKKVLHIVEAFGSGIFYFLVDLVNNTDEEFDITICYGKRAETPENFKQYFSDRVKFVEIKNFTRQICLKKDIKAYFEVRKIIREIKPDIIHLHSSKAGFIGRFAANSRKTKLLYTPHGFAFFMANVSKIKRRIYWFIEKFSTIKKCTVVGCSQGEYKETLKLTKNAICINNGININDIYNYGINPKEIDTSKPLSICVTGRIAFQKNPEIFNQIAMKFPEYKFIWIGDGGMKNKLTSPNIEVTGWKSREEVLEILNKTDIFLLPSLWEGLSISLLEAMYLEKICIVSDIMRK